MLVLEKKLFAMKIKAMVSREYFPSFWGSF
jgi:hypothetical protein